MRRVLVIGGVAAGPAAAARAKRVDPNADVLLVEQGEAIAYGVCELPNWLSGEIRDRQTLIPHSPETFSRDYGVRVRTFSRAEEIRTSRREVVIRDLYRGGTEALPYDRLVIATGSRARPLGVSGERAPNVFRLKTLEEATGLSTFLADRSPRRAVVVGGGYIGLEAAEALRVRGLEVVIVERSAELLPLFDALLRRAAAELATRHGVEVRTSAEVKELSVDGRGWVRSVGTTSGDIPSDVIVVATGLEPETTLAEQAGIRVGESGGIRVDARQTTSLDTVLAAGDCCESRDAVTGRWALIQLASVAARQGRVAGENAAGGRAACRDVVPAGGLRFFGTDIVQVGWSEEHCKRAGLDVVTKQVDSTDRVPILPEATATTLRLTADAKTGRLLGGAILGTSAAAAGTMLSLAVHERLTVKALSTIDPVYAPSLAPFKDPWTIAGRSLLSALED